MVESALAHPYDRVTVEAVRSAGEKVARASEAAQFEETEIGSSRGQRRTRQCGFMPYFQAASQPVEPRRVVENQTALFDRPSDEVG